jgi:large subunit ribosomal protein L31
MSPGRSYVRRRLLRVSGGAHVQLSRKEKQVRGKHPEFVVTHVRCNACGSEFTTRSSRAELALGVCSSCHPAYTGIEQPAAQGSRVDRFERRRAQARARPATTV